MIRVTAETYLRRHVTVRSPDRPCRSAVKPKTKYAREGDVCIAYQVFGEGPTEIVHTWGPATHVEYMWEHPRVARFYDRLGSFARIVLFDRRGTGASDPTAGPPTLEQQIQDM